MIALSLLVDIAVPGLNVGLSALGLRSPLETSGSSCSCMFDEASVADTGLFGSRYVPVSYIALTLWLSSSTSSERSCGEGETSKEKLGAPLFTRLVRTGRLIAFFPDSITLPLFENESFFRKSSSSRLSVGILVVMGVKFSTDVDLGISGGVLGLLLLLEEGRLHREEVSELKLPLFVTFTSGSALVGDSGALWILTAGALMLVAALGALSSTVLTEPSRALEDVVGASPESLFQFSSSLTVLVVRRRAGWVSVGGARGGATVTGMGGFAGSVSS